MIYDIVGKYLFYNNLCPAAIFKLVNIRELNLFMGLEGRKQQRSNPSLGGQGVTNKVKQWGKWVSM
jgi:hypothetical protein